MRLSTQYRSRDINLLYLVAHGNFTPLLGFRQSEPSVQETPGVFQIDFVLRDFEDCFDDKPGKPPKQLHLEVDPLKPPVVHPPRKNCSL